MAISDIFKTNKYKAEIEQLNRALAESRSENYMYKSILTDEHYQAIDIHKKIGQLKDEEDAVQKNVNKYQDLIKQLEEKIKCLKSEIVELDEEKLLQDFGLYKPMYDFATSSEYKEKLFEVRTEQKKMIKSKTAAICTTQWTVNNNRTQGKKMTNDSIKQVIITFNIECENAINKVTFCNYESMRQRIERAYKKLNELNRVHCIYISNKYLELKKQELSLAYEYAKKKQEEKEELKMLREIQRENARVAKELEEERQRIEKEQQHYNNVMKRLLEQIEIEKSEERLALLLAKKVDIENNLADLDKALKEVDYREANQRAGYVYVISNVGAFGEDVYKIGMTRRLDPQDRIDELGGASVPFKFDVHAIIFSDDAPRLENALHNAFASKRINAMNNRKEFFKVTLAEIEDVVKKNHDKTVNFVYYPTAQQYRETLKLRELESN